MYHRVGLLGCIVAIVWAAAVAESAGPVKNKPIPPLAVVRQAVLQYFQALPDYRPGDLITREEVEPLLARLKGMGLPLADGKQILEKAPAKGEFLVDQLSTPKGRALMRRISACPNAYDRLDRLSRMPHGQQTIRDLIKGPGGEKLVEYLTRTSGGKELGRMLADAPQGKQFNAPTGRIYTAAMLLDRLRQSRAAALEAAAGKGGKT